MVDTADSKSAEGNLMPVRVRPPLPGLFEKGLQIILQTLFSSMAHEKPVLNRSERGGSIYRNSALYFALTVISSICFS
jgi:hypothetical protein